MELHRVPPQPNHTPLAYRNALAPPVAVEGMHVLVGGDRSPSPTVSPLSGNGREQVHQQATVENTDDDSSHVTSLKDTDYGSCRRRLSAFETVTSSLQATAAANTNDGEDSSGDVDLVASARLASAAGAESSTTDDDDAGVTVRLEHKDLWDKFDELGTEMVITKSGR